MNKRSMKLSQVAALMMNDPHEFEPGDLITWKCAELQDKTEPEIGHPAIVLEVLDEPVVSWKNYMNEEASHYTWGRLDLIIGVMPDSDGELRHFGVDSRRFTYFTE